MIKQKCHSKMFSGFGTANIPGGLAFCKRRYSFSNLLLDDRVLISVPDEEEEEDEVSTFFTILGMGKSPEV